ncbi:hypothetical protein [Glaciimonas soli]|uniref:Uncharacterized protein n=1 Tax=Glaciimonas soli TaxID=2590999 RepID=A0A843YRK8_9BURK|nr:hypothetical protein [Glaciimonas soli]MQR02389.1 hypothetical protein [Glaciimonas soli]
MEMNLIEKFDVKLKNTSETFPHQVEVYEELIEAADPSITALLASQHLGPRQYRLSDGRKLKPLSDTKFIIESTGEELHQL